DLAAGPLPLEVLDRAREEAAIPLRPEPRAETVRTVVGAADTGDRPDARIERPGTHRVAPAQADADDADAVGVDLGTRGEVADGVAKVCELAGRVLVLARLAVA